jgi:hypothetical protein
MEAVSASGPSLRFFETTLRNTRQGCLIHTRLCENLKSYAIALNIVVFHAVAALAWSEDPESYTGGSIATGRDSHDEQVTGDDTDKKDNQVLQVGG